MRCYFPNISFTYVYISNFLVEKLIGYLDSEKTTTLMAENVQIK